jgi:hypothetical protein
MLIMLFSGTNDCNVVTNNQQRLILVAGMIRSGSTWLYNAARLILIYESHDVYGCWIDDLDENKAGVAGNVLVKIHAMNDAIASKADIILTCHRDLRDVALSIQDIGWASDDSKVVDQVGYARACHDYWLPKAALNISYEYICGHPIDALRKIAKVIGCHLSERQLADVATELSNMKIDSTKNGYDLANLLHPNHKSNGTPGRWRKDMNVSLFNEIESRHGDWLGRYGYSTARPMISVLGSLGAIDAEKAQNCTDLVRRVGNNTGNLVFQYAVNELLDVDKKAVGAAGISYGDPRAFSSSQYLVFPAANLLRPGVDFRPLAGFLKKSPIPLIVLGLGAQADDLAPEEDAINTIVSDPNVQLLADAIRSRAVFVSVRGAFSKRVCDALGIEGAVVLGCPSLLLNPNPDLGLIISRQLERAKQKAAAADIKIAVSAAAPFEIHANQLKLEVERKLFSWVMKYRGFYIQQSGGEDVINYARNRHDEVPRATAECMGKILAPHSTYAEFQEYSIKYQRLYIDARRWADDLESQDLVLGTRMHGNMIALASGTPCIHIAHDSRTSELIDVMKLPMVSMDDVLNSADILALIRRVRFDQAAFDANRKAIASIFADRLAGLGIQMAGRFRSLINN